MVQSSGFATVFSNPVSTPRQMLHFRLGRIPVTITEFLDPRETPMRIVLLLPILLAAFAFVPVRADKAPAKIEVEYTDDSAILKSFTDKLGALAKDGKCLKPEKLKELIAVDIVAKLKSGKPNDKALSAEELAVSLKASVFIIGSVVKEAEEYTDGRMATAWVLGAEGILVTNWHVFDEIGDDESFGVRSATGEVFPVTGILARDKAADIAIFQVDAKGLIPLPVASQASAVASWVGVLGHPGDRYFTFTQGHVTRYTKYKNDDDIMTKWMAIDADYAYGSSGSPVVDRFGNVVGMAALTESIDYPEEGEKAADMVLRKRMVKVRKKADEKVKVVPSALQMVVKLTVPASELRRVMGAE